MTTRASIANGVVRANAHYQCMKCNGTGRLGRDAICGCVYRSVWRQCWRRAVELCTSRPRVRQRGRGYDFPFLDYAIDVSMRALSCPTAAREVLSLSTAGADWRAGCGALHIDKGTWFHRLYHAEELAGKECLARGLFPPPR